MLKIISRLSSENIKAKSLFVIFSLVLSWIPTRAELKTRNIECRLWFRNKILPTAEIPEELGKEVPLTRSLFTSHTCCALDDNTNPITTEYQSKWLSWRSIENFNQWYRKNDSMKSNISFYNIGYFKKNCNRYYSGSKMCSWILKENYSCWAFYF